jgi:glutaredoxin
MKRARAIVAVCRVALVGLIAASSLGCPKKRGEATADPASGDAPIVLKADSAGLLLTWIDDKGDFHVEQSVVDVPLEGRDVVRVIDPNRDEGLTSDKIFLADLRTARTDGTYAVRTGTRAEFDAIAFSRRAAKGPTLASAAPSSSAPGPIASVAGDPSRPDPNANGRPAVIIYGASWCGPCHEAEAYMRMKGISYVEKDIEKEPGAGREMQAKLEKAGKRGGSIPVLDVRGKILIGFNARAVDDALGKAM